MKNALIVMSMVLAMNTSAFAAKSTLPANTVEKVKRFFQNNEVSKDDAVSENELTGDAAAQFAKLEDKKACKVDKDPCPEAYLVNAYGTKVYLVYTEDTDGTSMLYVFDLKGNSVATGGATESGGLSWN